MAKGPRGYQVLGCEKSNKCSTNFKWAPTALLAIVLLGTLLELVVSAGEDHAMSQGDFARDVQACFYEQIYKQKVGYQKSLFTEAFIAERLISHFEDGSEKLTHSNANLFCKNKLIPLYVQAHAEAQINIKEESTEQDNILAPLGSEAIELNNKFIQITNNFFLRHNTTGHSDLTQLALQQLPKDLLPSPDGIKLIVRASQTPDLYRWEKENYHAHTKAHKTVNRAKAIGDSQEIFKTLMKEIMDRILQRVREKNYPAGLFWIGVACHPLQDLVYHRGITLSQHAGLSYVLDNSDPDFPTGTLFQSRVDQSVSYCKMFIETALKKTADAQSHLLRWTIPNNFDLRDLAQREFDNDTDMTAISLLKYWWLSRAYLNGERPMSELGTGNNGLISWNVEEVVLEVWTRLELR